MARAGFGGSGDYSGLFGSLYSGTRDLARQQQDADDQDALDRWSNGLMTDEEWVAYIRQRINEEAGDPKRQQKWVTALRKYEPAIADQQAEQAYEQGGSINDLVAHYRQRLASLETNSNGYREVQDKLNDALDKQASDNIQTGAENIVNQINKGKATYEDLLKFLKTSKAQTRPNSSLFESLGKQITQVQETIRTNDIEGDLQEAQYKYDTGKLSASAFASLIKQKAALFKTSDPKRYYQMLGAAADLGGRSGGGGGGGGGSYRVASGAQKTAKQKLNDRIDGLQAQRNALQAMIQQYEENPAGPVIDPRTGAATVLSPGAVKGLDQQLVKTWDAMAAAYTQKGDKSAAANSLKSKAAYVSTHVVEHNTIPAAEQSTHLLGAVNKMLDTALQNPDPQAGLSEARAAAGLVNKWVTSLQKTSTKQTTGPAREIDFGKTDVQDRGPMDRVDPALIARATALGQALTTLSDENTDDASAAAALDTIRGLDGSAPGGTQEGALVSMAKKALQINGTRQGLLNGDLERVITTAGISYIPKIQAAVSTVINGSVVTTLQKVPDDSSLISDRKTQKMVDVFIDINGQPTKVKAVASQTSPSGAMAWYAKSQIKLDNGKVIIPAGGAIPSDIVNKYADQIGSKAELRPAFTFSQVQVPAYTDSRGNHPAEVWSQDPETDLWYKGSLPLRNIQYNPDGTVTVDSEGKAQYDYKAYASSAGVTAPYAGSNPKAMQDIANQGLAGKPRGTRDVTGRYNPDGEYNGAYSYYDPAHTFGSKPEERDSWWDDEERAQKAAADTEAFKAKVRAEDAKAKKEREDFVRKTLTPEHYQQWKADRFITESPFGGLLNAFGISMGTKASTPKKVGPLNGPRMIDEVDPSAVKKIPNASSGPKLSSATGFNLDLKKTSAATINVKKPAATTTTKKGTTTKTSAPKVTAKPKTTTTTTRVQNTTTSNAALDRLRLTTGGGR